MDRALCESVVIAGKYRLERSLARGGMGSVWAARHIALDMPVALKFMDADTTSTGEARTRFEREARAAAQLRSPHVIQIIDQNLSTEPPFIVMELLEGESLSERLRRIGRLGLAEAATIAVQVAKALRCAHEAGIVHRDLKPANIFLVQSHDDEIVKVLDFGIAKSSRYASEPDVTQTGIVIGSPSYMSPEQLRGLKSLDHRSDLWSLGVILFRMLTGEALFPGESAIDVALRVCSEPLPPPTSIAPDLPSEIDDFFMKALCRHPEGRFQTAREFSVALIDLARRAGSFVDVPLSSQTSPVLARSPNVPHPLKQPPEGAIASRPTLSEHRKERSMPSRQELFCGPSTKAVERCDLTLCEGRAASPFNAPATFSRDCFVTPRTLQTPRRTTARERLARAEMSAIVSLIDEGLMALNDGNREEARRLWTAALDLDPSNPIVELNLQRLNL